MAKDILTNHCCNSNNDRKNFASFCVITGAIVDLVGQLFDDELAGINTQRVQSLKSYVEKWQKLEKSASKIFENL